MSGKSNGVGRSFGDTRQNGNKTSCVKLQEALETKVINANVKKTEISICTRGDIVDAYTFDKTRDGLKQLDKFQ